MSFLFAFILLGVVAMIALVIALSRHKKSATGELQLIDAVGVVESNLTPEGSVLIAGELWRARSVDGSEIARNSKVRVVEIQDHLLIVRRDA